MFIKDSRTNAQKWVAKDSPQVKAASKTVKGLSQNPREAHNQIAEALQKIYDQEVKNLPDQR